MNNFLQIKNNILIFHRLFLLLPDITLNVVGTMWLYSNPRWQFENHSLSASIVRGKTNLFNITKDETLSNLT